MHDKKEIAIICLPLIMPSRKLLLPGRLFFQRMNEETSRVVTAFYQGEHFNACWVERLIMTDEMKEAIKQMGWRKREVAQ